MNTKRKGDLYALLCALIIGLGNITAKVGLEFVTPELFNFYLFLFAFGISLFTLFNPRQRHEIKAVTTKTMGLIFLLSALFAFGIYFFTKSIQLIEPATVSFLSRLEAVILIVLAYIFLKERLGKYEIIGGIVALGGVFVLKFQSDLALSQAATLMIVSVVFFAGAEILVKKHIHSLGISRFLFYRNFFTTIIMMVLVWSKGQALYIPSTKILLLIFATTLFFPVFGRVTFLLALKRIDISRAAFITQATPLFTAVFALLILQSFPTSIEWLGGAIIFIGVIIVQLSGNRSGK